MLWILFLVVGGVAVWQLGIAGGVGARRLECPACDLYIVGTRVRSGESVVCPHCRAVALFDGKGLAAPPDDHVAPAPVFCAELPVEGMRWPERCCACDAPATRGVTISLQYEESSSLGRDLATRAASLGVLRSVDRTTISLQVPHCERHADGAARAMPYEREQPSFGIVFRSYAYFRDFVALNHVTPRKATLFGGATETT